MGIKKLFIILSCIFLSGCTLNYNLYFDKDEIIETIDGEVNNDLIKPDYFADDDNNIINNDEIDNYYYYLINDKQLSLYNNDTEFYESNITKKNINTQFLYKYSYNYKNIKDSRIFNECFENVFFEEKDNMYMLSIRGPILCDMDIAKKINIFIKSKFKIECNGEISKNVCKYTIDKNNKDNVDISVIISKKNLKFSFSKLFDFIIIVLIIGCISVFKIYKKKISNN